MPAQCSENHCIEIPRLTSCFNHFISDCCVYLNSRVMSSRSVCYKLDVRQNGFVFGGVFLGMLGSGFSAVQYWLFRPLCLLDTLCCRINCLEPAPITENTEMILRNCRCDGVSSVEGSDLSVGRSLVHSVLGGTRPTVEFGVSLEPGCQTPFLAGCSVCWLW